jgi:hypothetical protein
VLFSDEVRIYLKHIDGHRRVWRRPGEQHDEACVQQKTAYGGGSIMFWPGISIQYKTQLVRLNGNLNAQQYIAEVLNPHVLLHALQEQTSSFSMIMPGPMLQMWYSSRHHCNGVASSFSGPQPN